MKVLKTVVSKHGTTRKNASARTHMCLNLYDLLSCYIYFAFPSFCGGTLMTLFFFFAITIIIIIIIILFVLALR